MVPEQGQKDDDRKWNSDEPEKKPASKSHCCLQCLLPDNTVSFSLPDNAVACNPFPAAGFGLTRPAEPARRTHVAGISFHRIGSFCRERVIARKVIPMRDESGDQCPS